MTTPKGGHVFDLITGETMEVDLSTGRHEVTLLEVHEPRCRVRGVIRFPGVTLYVNSEKVYVPAALYHMPLTLEGIRIGCSVTRGVAETVGRFKDVYAFEKDARIRCWAPEDPLFDRKPLVYPVGQTWFASMTQMANERTYVDAGEFPFKDPAVDYIYHHYGMDFGGYENAVPIIAARGGRIICVGNETVEGYDENVAGTPRYDRVVVEDETGWCYRYSHIEMISQDLELDRDIPARHFIGTLGKEGSSGGWSHLHFSICSPQPSGRYGEVEGYPFLVESYLNEHPGSLLACARPHRVAEVGEPVELDGSRSVCDGADIVSGSWTFHDGECVKDIRATRTYNREGTYSEMLTVTDSRGQTDIDFCVVQVLPGDADPVRTAPGIHLTHYPTRNLCTGQPIAFKVRTFCRGPFEINHPDEESWDFGDGSSAVTRSSSPARSAASTDTDYAERWHTYDKPGRFIVTVTCTGTNGLTATAKIKVDVNS